MVECRHCGARLDLPDQGGGVATCQYCGTETLVHNAQQPPPQQQQWQQQQWAQQQWQQANQYAQQQAQHVQRTTSRVGIIIAFATILPLIVGGIIAFVTFQTASSAVQEATANLPSAPGVPGPSGGSAPEPEQEWLGRICLTDANGDNALDVAGLSGERESASATILDGNTGEPLWKSGSYTYESQIFCPTDGWIGVATPEDFEVDLFPVDDPEGRIQRTLSDEPRAFGAAEGCITLRSSDDRSVGVKLPEGTETDCSAKAKQDIRAWPGMQHLITRDVYRVEAEGVRYELRERQKGTEFLEVSAEDGGEQLFDVPLRFVRVGGSTGALAMVPTPGTLVVLGSDRKNDDTLHVAGLDAKTGVERWSKQMANRPAVNINSLHYNGRYAIYTETWNDEVVALDPATGEVAWRVGG